MSVSSVSPSVASSVAPAAVNKKTPASPALQPNKPVAPPAVKSGADSDSDHDGSGGRVNVKA